MELIINFLQNSGDDPDSSVASKSGKKSSDGSDHRDDTFSTPSLSATHAYAASPTERLADALVSLDFLLTHELPMKWTEV